MYSSSTQPSWHIDTCNVDTLSSGELRAFKVILLLIIQNGKIQNESNMRIKRVNCAVQYFVETSAEQMITILPMAGGSVSVVIGFRPELVLRGDTASGHTRVTGAGAGASCPPLPPIFVICWSKYMASLTDTCNRFQLGQRGFHLVLIPV